MAIIAVTGASGFVGSHLCPALVERGHQVLELSRARLLAPELASSITGANALVHLAARAHSKFEKTQQAEAEFQSANMTLTQRIGRAADQARIPRFVFLSSAGVLGKSSPPGGFDDQTPTAPYDAYTRSKRDAEHWLRHEPFAQMQVSIVRAPLVYGPGAPGNFARLLAGVTAGWPLPLGALDARRSMVGIRNLIDLLHAAAIRPEAAGLTMLVADRETMTVAELARELYRLQGRSPRLIAVPKSVLRQLLRLSGRSADIARLLEPFELRPTLAAEWLRWSPPFSLAQELRRIVTDPR